MLKLDAYIIIKAFMSAYLLHKYGSGFIFNLDSSNWTSELPDGQYIWYSVTKIKKIPGLLTLDPEKTYLSNWRHLKVPPEINFKGEGGRAYLIRGPYEMHFSVGCWMRSGILVNQLKKSFLPQVQMEAGEGNGQRMLTQGPVPGLRKGGLLVHHPALDS